MKNCRLSSIWLWFSSVISAPVRTSVSLSGPRACSMLGASSSSGTVPSPRTWIESRKPGLPTNSWAVARSKSEKVAPPGESASPKRAMPARVNSRAPVVLAIWMRSPIEKLPLSALALSMAVSSGPVGDLPSTKSHVSRSPDSVDAPNVGGAVVPETSGLPSLPMMAAKPETSPWASATPGTAATSATRLSGMRSRCSLAELGLDHVRRADEGVGVAEHVREQRVERPLDGVGEDVRRGEERGGDDHRESGHEQAGLVGEDALQADLEHALSPRTASSGPARARPSVRASRRRSCRRRGTRPGRSRTRPSDRA